MYHKYFSNVLSSNHNTLTRCDDDDNESKLCNDENIQFTTFQMVLKTPYNNTLFTFHIIRAKVIRL